MVPSGASKLPAGMIASRPLRVRCGIGQPHLLQNAVAKLRACGRSKRATDVSPRSQRSAEALTMTSRECAVPLALLLGKKSGGKVAFQGDIGAGSLRCARDDGIIGLATRSSLRAQRSNPESRYGDGLDCFVALLLAMTARRHGAPYFGSPPSSKVSNSA